MPHVVLNGDINCEKAFAALNDVFVKQSNGILKTTAYYLDKKKQTILVQSLAIEEGKKTDFLAMLNNRDDGLVIRIYPGNDDIEKTVGVKKILVKLAKQLLSKFDQIKIGKTNLQDLFD